MTRSGKFSVAIGASLATAIAAFLVPFGGHSASTSAHGAKFVAGLTPVQTKRVGNSSYAEYSSDPKAQLPAAGARRQPRRVTARTAAAEQEAHFGVLRRSQTPAEASDPTLQIVTKQRPDLDINRTRALDASRTYWLLPTSNGQICLGQKTTGIRIFAMVCGDDLTVAKVGLAQRLGDDLAALLPDGATDSAANPSAVRVQGNLLVAPNTDSASFELNGADHRVSG
jgi:hypothetical protein